MELNTVTSMQQAGLLSNLAALGLATRHIRVVSSPSLTNSVASKEATTMVMRMGQLIPRHTTPTQSNKLLEVGTSSSIILAHPNKELLRQTKSVSCLLY